MLRISEMFIDSKSIRDDIRSHVSAGSRPELSWSVISDKECNEQTAFRIKIGNNDLGWIQSESQSYTVDEGMLKEGGYADIVLTIKDRYGETSAPFNTRIYNGNRTWDIPWIGISDESTKPIYFRKEFVLPANVCSARLYYCGLGYATVYINGKRLDDAWLDPAFTDYSKRVEYVCIPEVKQNLISGSNTIEVVVAAGWRGNRMPIPPQNICNIFGPLQLSLSLECLCDDASEVNIHSDESWQAGYGPISDAGLFSGEVYNANINEFDEKMNVVLLQGPGGRMVPSTLQPIKKMASHRPIAVWNDGEDACVLDFGKNIAGILSVPLLHGEQGDRVILTHTEEITEDGHLFRDTLRGATACDEYIFSGDARDLKQWTPEFTYHGFRYARIEGVRFVDDLYNVEAIELRNETDKKTNFRCGNALINTIHDICVATEKANQHSIFTDCPQRDERMGWMNDATVRFEFTPYITDTSAFFPKMIRDVMDTQTPEGAIGCTAPFLWGNIPADPVCSAYIVAGMQSYLQNGDTKIIKEAYPSWVKWEEYLLSRSENYIVDYSYYGDWAGPVDCCVPEPNDIPGARSAVTPGIYMSTCYSYLNAKMLSGFADILGLAEDKEKYEALSDKIKTAIVNKWYQTDGSFATGSQGCLAFALYLGISPQPELTAMKLHEAFVASDFKLTTGNLCSRYILDALTEHGYVEDAWKLMTRTEYPSLGYMISQEATTVWERFELMKNSVMNSHNHPMYAPADYWMFAHLAGVKPIGKGWTECEIHPYIPNNLNSTQANIETPLGMVCVRWTKRYEKINLQVQIPFGMKARIRFGETDEKVGSGFHTYAINLL